MPFTTTATCHRHRALQDSRNAKKDRQPASGASVRPIPATCAGPSDSAPSPRSQASGREEGPQANRNRQRSEDLRPSQATPQNGVRRNEDGDRKNPASCSNRPEGAQKVMMKLHRRREDRPCGGCLLYPSGSRRAAPAAAPPAAMATPSLRRPTILVPARIGSAKRKRRSRRCFAGWP